MIKILFFIDNISEGGAQKVLLNLVNHMDQNKFDITVQTLFYDEFCARLCAGIKYKYCYSNGQKLLMRMEAALGQTYRQHIVDDYDIEVAFLESIATKIIASSTNKTAKKLAWVHCDFDIAIKEKDLYIRKTKKWYQQYHRVICVSEKCRTSFISMFGEVPGCDVLYNVIDSNEIRKKASEKIKIFQNCNIQRPLLVSVGRLTQPKNYIRLLKCAKKLHETGHKFTLWILGEGEERTALENFIEKNNLCETVKLLGFQDNPYSFISQADLLVCSSNFEGYSTFITEGLILGRPIITTDCSGMRDLLGESEYGIITENDDDSLCCGIEKLISDEQLLGDLAIASKQRGTQFETKQLVSAIEDYLMLLLRK